MPQFNSKQRKLYLEFTLPELSLARAYKGPITSVYFLLQLAYFCFKQQFFIFDLNEVKADVSFLAQHYFAEETLPTQGGISKPTRLSQQRVILELMKYRISNQEIRTQLLDRASYLATISASPLFLFRDLMNWAEQNRIVLPAYSIMQRHIISRALTGERHRLEELLAQHLTKASAIKMDNLINVKVGYYYGLTWLQQEVPNFNPQSIRRETERKQMLEPLFQVASRVLQKLAISNENITYYASLARHYTVGELRQFTGGLQYIFILALVYHRYRTCNDVLAEAFKYYMRKYETAAKQRVRDFFSQFQQAANEQLEKIPLILSLFLDENISDDTPFIRIKRQALDILDQEKIILLTDFIKENHMDETELRWQYYGEIQKQISYNLRHIFKFLDFSSTTESHQDLLEAATLAKSIFSKGKTLKKADWASLPKDFIPQYLQPYIFKKEEFIASRYELALYLNLNRQLQAGNLSIKDSISHQSLEEDLIPLAYWKQNKPQILKQIALEKLSFEPEVLLDKIEKELELKIKTVNQAIIKGKNSDVKLKKGTDGSLQWKLIYHAQEEETNHQLYNQFPIIGVVSLLNWVNSQTDFCTAFRHILEKGGRKKQNRIYLLPVLLLWERITESGILLPVLTWNTIISSEPWIALLGPKP